MKKVLKKLLVVILIFLTISSFVLTNRSYAGVGDVIGAAMEGLGTAFISILAWPVQIVVTAGGMALNAVTAGIAYIDGATEGADTSVFITPFDILFNKVKIVDVNVFDLSDEDSIVGQIRGGVATWYYVLRMIATAILLVVLIYVGIRMALSTVASDKAMYKKMLVDWACSLALIFLLQYIIIFTFNVNTAIVNAMAGVTASVDGVSEVFQSFGVKGLIPGPDGIGAAAVYFILVTQTIGLLISYINRMLKISFLIIISPLITLTYSIDKMGDGKAQALGTWLKEFVFSTLIQPFHCIIYMIMVSTSLQLLTANGGELGYAILAILCIKFIQDAEKIVRKIFHFEDDNSGTSVAAGMATSALLLSQSKNIGKNLKAGATGIKNLKTNAGNLLTHAKTDAMVISAIAHGNNKKEVKVTDSNGNETGETETQTMSMAELREEAMAKQIEQKADKLAKKVYGDKDTTKAKYSAAVKESQLSEKDKARYEVLKDSGMSHARAMATLRKEKLEKKKKEDTKLKHPTITGFTTRVGDTAKAIGQMETFKDLQGLAKGYMAVGVGSATAIGLWGNGSNVVTAISSGAAAYGASKEFMKNSSKTLVNTAVQSVMALGANNREDAERMLTKVLNRDSSYFEKDSTELKSILENLKQQLQQLGMDESSITHYSNNIQSQIKSNAAKGNPKSINEILTDNINRYNNDPETQNKIDLGNPETKAKLPDLASAAFNYSDFENEKIIFEGMQSAAQSTGMSPETYMAETAREIERLKGIQVIDNSFTNGRAAANTEEVSENPTPTQEEPREQFLTDEKLEEEMGTIAREAYSYIDKNDINLAEKMGEEAAERVTKDMEEEAKRIIDKKIEEIEEIYKIENEQERLEALGDLESQLLKEFNEVQSDNKAALSTIRKGRGTFTEEQDIGYSMAYVQTEFQRAAMQEARDYLAERKDETIKQIRTKRKNGN